jgi:hypothetical protein
VRIGKSVATHPLSTNDSAKARSQSRNTAKEQSKQNQTVSAEEAEQIEAKTSPVIVQLLSQHFFRQLLTSCHS